MRIVDFHVRRRVGTANDWTPAYPNPADFQFDYAKLLGVAGQNNTGIGMGPFPQPRVIVIGAGSAGLTAARELYRCGYQVTILEASDRLCGRHYTVPIPGQQTAMELGAMRFPFFCDNPDDTPRNSLLGYYLKTEAPSETAPFPNPGSAPNNTGVYMNGGLGPGGDQPTPTMIMWPYKGQIQDPQLNDLSTVVNRFLGFFTGNVQNLYLQPDWSTTWLQIANKYDRMSFSDLVFADSISTYNNDGWFGGFGMNDAQSEIFYTIGAGDGSWGAFYEIAAMWFIRCVMFGFNSNLQTIKGLKNPSTYPHYRDNTVNDSLGKPLPTPLYSGIQSLDEWLFYGTAPGQKLSLYDASKQTPNDVTLYTQMFATRIANDAANDRILVTLNDNDAMTLSCDYVVVTPNIWAQQMETAFVGFNPNDLPLEVTTSRNEQHLITSTKVFFPLNQCYWETTGIPQVIVTDTFVQDAYGVKWGATDNGALLASYTWEDDATKLATINDNDLPGIVLAKLDQIVNDTMQQTISPYVELGGAKVWRWAEAVGYNGCAHRRTFAVSAYGLIVTRPRVVHGLIEQRRVSRRGRCR